MSYKGYWNLTHGKTGRRSKPRAQGRRSAPKDDPLFPDEWGRYGKAITVKPGESTVSPITSQPGGGLSSILRGTRRAYELATAAAKQQSGQMAGQFGQHATSPASFREFESGKRALPGALPGGQEDLSAASSEGGGGGLDLSAFDTAEGSLRGTNEAAQHEIAKGLVDFLNRVTSGRDQYMQATAQQGQQAQGDLNAVLQQNQQQGAPILADLKAQGVDPANVAALIQGDQQALASQGALDKQFRQQMGSLQEGGFADARSAGALVQQGAQAQRENNFAQALAGIQAGRADARSAYAAQQSEKYDTGKYDAGNYEITTSKDDNLQNYLSSWGTGARRTYGELWNIAGHDPKKLHDLVVKREQDQPGYWKSRGLPNMIEFSAGAIDAFKDSKSSAGPTGRIVSHAGVGGSGQIDAGIAPYVDELLGMPGIRITSGYRDAKRNAAAGGVKNSNHLKGSAVDVVPPKGARDALKEWAHSRGAREVIDEGDHIHIAW